MKSRLKICSISVCLSALLATTQPISAQVVDTDEPETFDIELNTPTVTPKQVGALRNAMSNYEQSLIDQGLTVELIRDDQVLSITVELDLLFAPNSTTLLATAEDELRPLLEYTRHYGKFKILLAMHSDNTGSDKYKEWLCIERINSLYDYFDRHGSTPAMVYGYPMTDTQPLVNNNTRSNRAMNRRLEVYIVPGPELINNLKNKK
ncbi:MAG: OmpA family protein [Bacteroides sp.]|nr:OmpA family protein [Bacteroides sp.]